MQLWLCVVKGNLKGTFVVLNAQKCTYGLPFSPAAEARESAAESVRWKVFASAHTHTHTHTPRTPCQHRPFVYDHQLRPALLGGSALQPERDLVRIEEAAGRFELEPFDGPLHGNFGDMAELIEARGNHPCIAGNALLHTSKATLV